MKLFTLFALALTLALVGVVTAASADAEKKHAGIERGSDVESLDEDDDDFVAKQTTKHPQRHRTRRPPHRKPTRHPHPHSHPTRHPRPVHKRTTLAPNIPDYVFTVEPVTDSPPDAGNDTNSNSSSIPPLVNLTTTTANSPVPINYTTTVVSIDTTTEHSNYPAPSTVDPKEGQDCELFSIQENSFLSRLNYFKQRLLDEYAKINYHQAEFYKTIYVRKCTYRAGSDFGFNIHYLLKVSACRGPTRDGGNYTTEKDCNLLPSTVARCNADLLSDDFNFRGCTLDNLEKGN